MIFFSEIIFVEWYSYNNKYLSLLNASYLLNAPAWTYKAKRRPGSLRVFISLLQRTSRVRVGSRPRAKPLPIVSLKVQPAISLFNTSDLVIQ